MFSTRVALIHGVCYARVVWTSRLAVVAYNVWYFMSFFVVVIFIFIFCYGRILVVIRRQASVMAGHSGPGPSTVSTQSQIIQSNIVKTMLLVSAFYVITWTPINVYYMILSLSSIISFNINVHHILLFLEFVYICANPFIYASKLGPVKQILVALIPCKNTSQQAGGNVEMN